MRVKVDIHVYKFIFIFRLFQLFYSFPRVVFIASHLDWIKWNAMEINVLFRDKKKRTQIDVDTEK